MTTALYCISLSMVCSLFVLIMVQPFVDFAFWNMFDHKGDSLSCLPLMQRDFSRTQTIPVQSGRNHCNEAMLPIVLSFFAVCCVFVMYFSEAAEMLVRGMGSFSLRRVVSAIASEQSSDCWWTLLHECFHSSQRCECDGFLGAINSIWSKPFGLGLNGGCYFCVRFLHAIASLCY